MEKEYRSVRVGGMSESSYGTATMECFKREKLGNYTVLFVGPWTPDKLRAIGEFCRKDACYRGKNGVWKVRIVG